MICLVFGLGFILLGTLPYGYISFLLLKDDVRALKLGEVYETNQVLKR